MNWNDSGFLLSKNKYSENSVIAEIFTKNNGKVSGIIFGASSKKIKNYLQVGNKLHLNYFAKSDSRIGNFKVEIDEILTPIFFDDRKKLACILSALNLIKLLTVEFQENKNIYLSIDNFFKILSEENWLRDFVLWELEFLKIIGYDLKLEDLVSNEIVNGKVTYFVKSNGSKKIIPSFLIEKNLGINNNTELLNGLKLVGDYLDKTILKPNSIPYPNSRLEFINLINKSNL